MQQYKYGNISDTDSNKKNSQIVMHITFTKWIISDKNHVVMNWILSQTFWKSLEVILRHCMGLLHMKCTLLKPLQVKQTRYKHKTNILRNCNLGSFVLSLNMLKKRSTGNPVNSSSSHASCNKSSSHQCLYYIHATCTLLSKNGRRHSVIL